ncbi:MAG: hypothetical protein M3R25_07650 [Bacteroidota bacterium]|nr:hypothetical protein [Bacteroidota bacterium]
MVCANERSNIPFRKSNRHAVRKIHSKSPVKMTLFSWSLQQLLSTYARGINTKYNRTGSLFQQNTKSKCTSSDVLVENYSAWCFNYIHNNPKMAGLVSSASEYEFSSYRDYFNNGKDSICNLLLGRQLLMPESKEFKKMNTIQVPEEIMLKLFK